MFKFRFTILQCERVSELLGVRGGNHSVQGSRLRECSRGLLMFWVQWRKKQRSKEIAANNKSVFIAIFTTLLDTHSVPECGFEGLKTYQAPAST